ncbi:MAG: DUF4272 domain-containing protein [Pirellulaceae bacterium]|nr:DUF4272 domain-containing protein [Pirellulaceae bacterium]
MASIFDFGVASVTAIALRKKVFAELEAAGFSPAKSLPLPDMDQRLRPAAEVSARLMALDALFTWVAFLENSVATARIQNYIDRNRLLDWLTEKESAIVTLSRNEARDLHVDNIGWKLENMWAFAWVLGFDQEPTLEASQIEEDVTRPLIYEFLPGLDATVDQLLAKSTPRSTDDVIAMEYRFYCAHNAVRSAQLGGDTVPKGFHPLIHGGAVHERRHSLSWCLSPEVAWDETDLST